MNGYSSYSPGNDHPSIANSNHYAAAQNSYPQPRAFNEHGGGENDPRFNPLNNGASARSSLRVPTDSMSMHLLVEQAVYDSVDFEVLSYEEVEDLKKELKTLTNRIDSSKRKLAMESKVRDAALSLARLSAKKSRRSAASVASEKASTDDSELAASSRKCEELTQELTKLEVRATDVQKRLLEHSAGILGMVHKNTGVDGAPLSPPSEYTFAASRDPGAFDDRSFYRTADKLATFGETPRESAPANGSETKMSEADDAFVSEKLGEINLEIRGLLQTSSSLPDGPSGGGLQEQLAALEKNIQHLRQFPPVTSPSPNTARAAEELEGTDTILTTLWDMIINFDEEVREQKAEIRESGFQDPDYPESDNGDEPPEYSVSAFSTKVQSMLNKVISLRSQRDSLRERSTQQQKGVHEEMSIMQAELSNMGNQIEQLSSLLRQKEGDLAVANAKTTEHAEEMKDMQAALAKKSEELINAMHDLEVDRSGDKKRAHEMKDLEMSALAVAKEQRADLEQQLDELDKKLANRDEALVELETKYQDVKDDRDVTKAELDALAAETDGKINDLIAEIAIFTRAGKTAEEARDVAIAQELQLRQQLEQKDEQVKQLNGELEDLSAKVAETSIELVMAKVELDSIHGSKSERAAATAEAKAAALALERASRQPQSIDPGLLAEIENLEKKNGDLIDEIVKLKNERAEGANSENQGKRFKMLQKELDDMLKDFEGLTKQGIEAEQERSKLESMVDALKDKVEALETALAEEKIRLIGSSSPGEPRARETTTTNVLRQEFRKMMRDMRAEQARALRAEQEERRKLETMIRSMKKESITRRMTPVHTAAAVQLN